MSTHPGILVKSRLLSALSSYWDSVCLRFRREFWIFVRSLRRWCEGDSGCLTQPRKATTGAGLTHEFQVEGEGAGGRGGGAESTRGIEE